MKTNPSPVRVGSYPGTRRQTDRDCGVARIMQRGLGRLHLLGVLLLAGAGSVEARQDVIPFVNHSGGKLTELTFFVNNSDHRDADIAIGGLGPFTTVEKKVDPLTGKTVIKLSGAEIDAGGEFSITLQSDESDRTVVQTLSNTTYMTSGVHEVRTSRSSSTVDRLFGAVVEANPVLNGLHIDVLPKFGLDEWYPLPLDPPIDIPPGMSFYAYQISPTVSIDRFELVVGNLSASSWGVMANTWNTSQLLGDFAIDPSEILNHMTADFLTGIPGVAPTSWLYSDGRMIATFDGGLNPGDSSAVIWFTHPNPPGLGGGDLMGKNYSYLTDGGTVASGSIYGPVPEAGVGWLVAASAFGAVLARRRRPGH